MKSWAASFALHAAVLALASLLWLAPRSETAKAPLRWQVAFAPAPAPEPIRPPPPPRPPARKPPPARPEPAKPTPPSEVPVPRPAPVPTPALVPVPVPVLPAPAEPVPASPAPLAAPPAAPVKVVSPPPQSAPEHAAEVERRWYLALLERLRAMRRYPMAARRLGQEGVVLIEARIGPDGRLEAAEIKRGSGYPLLDKDALRLLDAAAEAARGELRPERPTQLEIPIAYRLEG